MLVAVRVIALDGASTARQRSCSTPLVEARRLPALAVAAIGIAIASLVVAIQPAYALCAAPQPRDAESMLLALQPDHVLFVGTVAETRAEGYNALLHVEQVWYGAPLNEWMTLRGSNDESWGATKEDIPRWHVGERFLVDAKRDGADLRSTACSYPLPWQGSITQTGRAVQAPPVPTWRPLLWPWQPLIGTLLIPMSAILVGVIASLVVLIWVRRRRRTLPYDAKNA